MESIFSLLQTKFFVYALIAAVLISISCGIIGTYIVTRRIVFLGGGITHASFGGIGIGYFLGINPLIGAAGFGLFSALSIEFFSSKGNLRNDSMIATLWALGMAVGIIFIYLTPGNAPNLMSYLFGNILTVSITEIYFMIILSLILVTFFVIAYNAIVFVSFDPEFSITQSMPVALINYILICLTALTIVLSIRVVGIIMALALLTIPQNIANLVSKKYKVIIFLAIGIGIVGTITGLMLSFYLKIPSGATIVFVLVIFFILLKAFKTFWK